MISYPYTYILALALCICIHTQMNRFKKLSFLNYLGRELLLLLKSRLATSTYICIQKISNKIDLFFRMSQIYTYHKLPFNLPRRIYFEIFNLKIFVTKLYIFCIKNQFVCFLYVIAHKIFRQCFHFCEETYCCHTFI